jgi:hypothetical protein
MLLVACECLFCIVFYSAVTNFKQQYVNVKFWLKFQNTTTEWYAILQTAYGAKALSHVEM